MSKFIESELYGSCQVNNQSSVYGKIYKHKWYTDYWGWFQIYRIPGSFYGLRI